MPNVPSQEDFDKLKLSTETEIASLATRIKFLEHLSEVHGGINDAAKVEIYLLKKL